LVERVCKAGTLGKGFLGHSDHALIARALRLLRDDAARSALDAPGASLNLNIRVPPYPPCCPPQSFFPHHLAAISSAIVRADALSIRNNAASLAFQLSHGII
jgi:hypothetical protein